MADAQWEHLEDLVDDEADYLEELPFLPGIVIQGHEWHRFATSCDRCWKDVWYERQMGNTAALAPKKTFWHGRVIGNTATLAGTVQLVHALQHLRDWIKRVYWPWFRANALGVLGG